jgi:hypothetical protein
VGPELKAAFPYGRRSRGRCGELQLLVSVRVIGIGRHNSSLSLLLSKGRSGAGAQGSMAVVVVVVLWGHCCWYRSSGSVVVVGHQASRSFVVVGRRR